MSKLTLNKISALLSFLVGVGLIWKGNLFVGVALLLSPVLIFIAKRLMSYSSKLDYEDRDESKKILVFSIIAALTYMINAVIFPIAALFEGWKAIAIFFGIIALAISVYLVVAVAKLYAAYWLAFVSMEDGEDTKRRG